MTTPEHADATRALLDAAQKFVDVGMADLLRQKPVAAAALVKLINDGAALRVTVDFHPMKISADAIASGITTNIFAVTFADDGSPRLDLH